MADAHGVNLRDAEAPALLVELAGTLTADQLIDAALAADAGRDEEGEALLARHHGLSDADLWLTPFAWRIAVLAREQGVFAFDRLERELLPAPAAWMHHELGEADYRVRRESERVVSPPSWPFAHDAPLADWASWRPPRELCAALTATLVGFGWWPEMSEWQLMHMARLGDATASWVRFWLAELGREYCPLHGPRDEGWAGDCPTCYALDRGTEDAEVRAERIGSAHGREIAESAVEMLLFEAACYRQGLLTGQLRSPSSRAAGLELGEACRWAKVHRLRLASPAFARWIEHCRTPGIDFAPDLAAFEGRCAAVVRGLLSPAAPSPDAPALAAARGRQVLADLGWRVCHAAELAGKGSDGFADALKAAADGIEALSAGPGEPGAILAEALAGIAAEAPAEVLTVGYRPTERPEEEPEAMRAARIGALRRRARRAGSPLAPYLEASEPVSARVVDGPRGARLVGDVVAAAEAAGEAGEADHAWAGMAGWISTATFYWGGHDRVADDADYRWYYALASRKVPPPGRREGYRIHRNPYLVELPAPYEAAWFERFLAGEEQEIRTSVSIRSAQALVGPGRERPRVLPLTRERKGVLQQAARTPTVAEVLDGGALGEEELAHALDEELLICLEIG